MSYVARWVGISVYSAQVIGKTEFLQELYYLVKYDCMKNLTTSKEALLKEKQRVVIAEKGIINSGHFALLQRLRAGALKKCAVGK